VLVASVGWGAAVETFDRSDAGPVARAGRLGAVLARFSVDVPVAVLIDDADLLDVPVTVALVRELVGRPTAKCSS
jgi:hypothetical protein